MSNIEATSSPDDIAPLRAFHGSPSGFYRGGAGGPHGDSVKVRKDDWPKPDKLFMIYMKFDGEGALLARHAAARIGGDLIQAEKALYQALADDKAGGGTNFENLAWTGPCYVTFVIDNPRWQFHWADCPNKAENEQDAEQALHDPVVFLRRKHLANGCEWRSYDQNKSFYDAERVSIHGVEGERDAVRCVNYFRDESGVLLDNGRDRTYCFEIYLEAPFAIQRNGNTERITILIDPDGQNQGPDRRKDGDRPDKQEDRDGND